MRTIPVYEIEGLAGIADWELEQILRLFSEHGCLIVNQRRPIAPKEISCSLAMLGRQFGNPVRHKLSDDAGVHPIRNLPGFSQYANTTSADLLLHTDGSFEKNPPKAMLIYCEEPAENGGYSRICFAEDIYEFLKMNCPQVLYGLFRPDAFLIKRDDREAQRSVFEVSGERVSMAFRYGTDVEIRVHPIAQDGFSEIIKFVSNPGYYAEFLLERGQLLLMDNTRVLHGRTTFPLNSHRTLHGLWCDGNCLNFSNMKFGFSYK